MPKDKVVAAGLTMWDTAKEACCQLSVTNFSSASRFNSIFSSEESIWPLRMVFGLGLDVAESGEMDTRETRGILWKANKQQRKIKMNVI